MALLVLLGSRPARGGKSATTVFGVGLKPSPRTLGRTPFYILTFTQWGKKIDIESFNR